MSARRTLDLYKKKKSLSEEDFEREYGRSWIWASLDPESKLLITFFVGRRTLEDCRRFISDLIDKLDSNPLFVSDESPHYKEALENQYGTYVERPRTGERGRSRKPKLEVDPELKYATVHKIRKNGKVVKVDRGIICGDESAIESVLSSSKVSEKINTAFLYRKSESIVESS